MLYSGAIPVAVKTFANANHLQYAPLSKREGFVDGVEPEDLPDVYFITRAFGRKAGDVETVSAAIHFCLGPKGS